MTPIRKANLEHRSDNDKPLSAAPHAKPDKMNVWRYAVAAPYWEALGVATIPLVGLECRSIEEGNEKARAYGGGIYAELRKTWQARLVRAHKAGISNPHIGLPLEKSRLVVIDVDDPDKLTDVVLICGETPAMVRTARGYHLYYRAPAGLPSERVPLLGVDVLSAGHVLAPGSVRLINGERFLTWPVGDDWPDDRAKCISAFASLINKKSTELPFLQLHRIAQLKTTIGPANHKRVKRRVGVTGDGPAFDGERGNALFDFARKQARHYPPSTTPPRAFHLAVEEFNQRQIRPPKSPSVIRSTVKSAWKYQTRDGWTDRADESDPYAILPPDARLWADEVCAGRKQAALTETIGRIMAALVSEHGNSPFNIFPITASFWTRATGRAAGKTLAAYKRRLRAAGFIMRASTELTGNERRYEPGVRAEQFMFTVEFRKALRFIKTNPGEHLPPFTPSNTKRSVSARQRVMNAIVRADVKQSNELEATPADWRASGLDPDYWGFSISGERLKPVSPEYSPLLNRGDTPRPTTGREGVHPIKKSVSNDIGIIRHWSAEERHAAFNETNYWGHKETSETQRDGMKTPAQKAARVAELNAIEPLPTYLDGTTPAVRANDVHPYTEQAHETKAVSDSDWESLIEGLKRKRDNSQLIEREAERGARAQSKADMIRRLRNS